MLVNIGRQHRELSQVALHLQNGQRLVKFMVADGHCLITQQVHAFEVRHGVLQVALWHAGVDITTVEQQAVAAIGRDLTPDAVNHRFACCHAVFAVAIFPKMAMVVIGVHHGDAVDFVFFGAACGCVGASRQCRGGQQVISDTCQVHEQLRSNH